MNDDVQRKTNLNRYLLGQVSPKEQEQIEALYFRDDELFEELVAAENDLIDSYIHGELSAAEKEQFEAHFLSDPERVERVEFARSLASAAVSPLKAVPSPAYKRSGPAISSSAVRLAIAGALVAISIGIVWLVMANHTLQRQLDDARTGQANAQRQAQELGRKVTALQGASGTSRQMNDLPPPGSATLSLSLVPDLSRGHAQQITIPLSPTISQVVLVLRRADDFPSYEAVLETAEGSQVWQKKNLESTSAGTQGAIVSVNLPPNVLQRGDYVLRLLRPATGQTFEELGVYSFRVTRPTEK